MKGTPYHLSAGITTEKVACYNLGKQMSSIVNAMTFWKQRQVLPVCKYLRHKHLQTFLGSFLGKSRETIQRSYSPPGSCDSRRQDWTKRGRWWVEMSGLRRSYHLSLLALRIFRRISYCPSQPRPPSDPCPTLLRPYPSNCPVGSGNSLMIKRPPQVWTWLFCLLRGVS